MNLKLEKKERKTGTKYTDNIHPSTSKYTQQKKRPIGQCYSPGYCQSVGAVRAELCAPPTGQPANPVVRSSVHCMRVPPLADTPPVVFAAMPGVESGKTIYKGFTLLLCRYICTGGLNCLE